MVFEKKEHRPWKTELLEETVIESQTDSVDNLFVVKNDKNPIAKDLTTALERAEQAELQQQSEIHSRLAAEKRMREAIEQTHIIEQQLWQLELENKTLEATITELFNKNSSLDKDMSRIIIQNENLESIIKSERELRRLAEDKAKRAVEQANQTIIQVLNSPTNGLVTTEKIKIRIIDNLSIDP